jgi:hypothetical protein
MVSAARGFIFSCCLTCIFILNLEYVLSSADTDTGKTVHAIRSAMDASNDDNIKHSHWLIQHPAEFRNLSMNIGRLLRKAESNATFIEKAAALRSFNPKGKRW